jgi:hypothetical protein
LRKFINPRILVSWEVKALFIIILIAIYEDSIINEKVKNWTIYFLISKENLMNKIFSHPRIAGISPSLVFNAWQLHNVFSSISIFELLLLIKRYKSSLEIIHMPSLDQFFLFLSSICMWFCIIETISLSSSVKYFNFKASKWFQNFSREVSLGWSELISNYSHCL